VFLKCRDPFEFIHGFSNLLGIVLEAVFGDPQNAPTTAEEETEGTMTHRSRSLSKRYGPNPPDYLDDIARAEWDRVLPELEELGFLDPSFTWPIEAYCSAFSTAMYFEGLCDEHGDDYVIREGTESAETVRSIADGWWDSVFEVASECGLTPESRRDISE